MKKKTKNRVTLFSILCIALSTMSFPLTTVYSETTTEIEAGTAEPVALESIIPDINSIQQEAAEPIAQEEIQEFSFSVETFQVVAGQIFELSFTSNFSASEVNIRVPEAGEIVQERLPENISVSHQEGEYWTIQSETSLTEFALPIVFSAVGGHFLSIDHDAEHFYVEVSEAVDEMTLEDATNEEIIPAIEKNLSIAQQLIDEETERVYQQTLDTINRTTSAVTNWSQFRSAWNASNTTRINLNTDISYSSSILGDQLNTRNSTIEISGNRRVLNFLNSGYSLIMSGGSNLFIEELTVVDFPGGALSRDSRNQPFIVHQGTGTIDLKGFHTQMRTGTASSVVSGRNINIHGSMNIGSFPENGTTANMNASAIHVTGGILKIFDLDSTRSFISATANVRTSLKPITSTVGSKIEIIGNRVSMGDAIRVTSTNASIHHSWHNIDVILTGLNGSQVEHSISSPNNFEEVYTQIFTRSDYNSLIFGASGGLWVEPEPDKGTVFVRHLDRSGNEIAPSETLTGEVGTNYSTQARTIEGYRLSGQPSNASGIFTAQDITVDYIYDRIEYGTVTVNYLDEEDNQLAETEILTGEVGTNYTAPEKSIEGYELVRRPDNISGTFSRENITVDFIYREIPKSTGIVQVNHIDINGEKLADSEEITGIVGEEYQTSAKEIQHYELIEEPENSTGVFTEEMITVDYIYNVTKVSPIDPIDPDQEVDPDNPPTLPEDQGLISIDFVSQFNFGEVAIRAGETAYGALPQRLLNENGIVSEEERPNFVQISDRRPESERGGWNLSATLAQTGFRNEKNERLVGAQISLHNQELATSRSNSESSSPNIAQSIPALIPGVKQNLLEANHSNGQGTWIYRFGDMETMDNSVKLELPAGANPKAERYEATIDWELSIVPGNE